MKASSYRPLGTIAALALVFVGLAVYHVLTGESFHGNPALLNELQGATLASESPVRTAGDWPQWRGPRRDGISTETDLVRSWQSSGPTQLWDAPLGGGYACPIIAGDRVYLIAQDGDHEAAICWDAAKGTELWRHRYPARFQSDQGIGPRSTPAIDGDSLYTVGATGIMHCLNRLDGKLVWELDLLTTFHGKAPMWGVSFSPLIDNTMMYVFPGGPDAAVVALDKRSHVPVWQGLSDSSSYSSPILASLAGTRQLLCFLPTRLVSLDPANGTLLWDFPWETAYGCNIATPIIAGDFVFISSGYGKGCAMLKVAREPTGGFSVESVYQSSALRNHFNSSVLWKDHIYGFDDATLVCLELRTGKVAWRERGFHKGSLTLADDILIILGEQGMLALAEPSPRGYKELARHRVFRDRCWTVPVVAHGRLYVRSENLLRCFELQSPKQRVASADMDTTLPRMEPGP